MSSELAAHSKRYNSSEGGYRVAVVGATGAVGTIMLEQLCSTSLPISEIVAFASSHSAGRALPGFGTIIELSETTIESFDIAIFSAGASVSAEWAPKFVKAGAVVIDNSSQWRRDPNVPLVVPEVNPDALVSHQGIIANPNCSTLQLVVALAPIHTEAVIERLIVSTYQSASGTGNAAVTELYDHTGHYLETGESKPASVYPHTLAANVIAAGSFPEDDDYSDEERKMMFETRKILGDETIAVSATCVRVPVPFCHSESVNVQTQSELSAERCRELLAQAPGIIVNDDPTKHQYPTPLDCVGRDEVFVGRIRTDPSHPRALNMWVVSDNLRKGAATNAVQIAELLHQDGLVRIAV